MCITNLYDFDQNDLQFSVCVEVSYLIPTLNPFLVGFKLSYKGICFRHL